MFSTIGPARPSWTSPYTMSAARGVAHTCEVCYDCEAMADCRANWCTRCYWLLAGSPSMSYHAACGVLHKVGPPRASCGSQHGREPLGADAVRPGAPAQELSVGDRYRDALAQANLPTGHILSFNNAMYFVFAGLEPDLRKKKAARTSGSMVVSDAVAPAVVRFAELNGSFVFACGCVPGGHNSPLLDVCVAGHEARAATSADGLKEGSVFARMHLEQAGLTTATSTCSGSCAHLCYAGSALLLCCATRRAIRRR